MALEPEIYILGVVADRKVSTSHIIVLLSKSWTEETADPSNDLHPTAGDITKESGILLFSNLHVILD